MPLLSQDIRSPSHAVSTGFQLVIMKQGLSCSGPALSFAIVPLSPSCFEGLYLEKVRSNHPRSEPTFLPTYF